MLTRGCLRLDVHLATPVPAEVHEHGTARCRVRNLDYSTSTVRCGFYLSSHGKYFIKKI